MPLSTPILMQSLANTRKLLSTCHILSTKMSRSERVTSNVINVDTTVRDASFSWIHHPSVIDAGSLGTIVARQKLGQEEDNGQ